MMKKYFLVGLLVSLMPNICLAYGPRYTQLVREKERKMAELEKCMGSTKGLKIAGVSTLGLTAAGVAGNIAEASTLKSYDKKIEDAKTNIEKTQKVVNEKEAELNKLKQQNQKPNQNQQGSAQASGTLSANNSYCSDLAKLPNVVKAETKEYKCIITECATNNYKPAEDGQSCVLKQNCGDINYLHDGYCVHVCPEGYTPTDERVCQENKPDGENDTEKTLVSNPMNTPTDEPKDNNGANSDCEDEVETAASMKWTFGKAVMFRNMASENELNVENDTIVYNRYKNQRTQEIYENKKRGFDEHIIQNGETASCNGYSVSYVTCLDKTWKECNEGYYNCHLEMVKIEAEYEAESEYIKELVNVICKK